MVENHFIQELLVEYLEQSFPTILLAFLILVVPALIISISLTFVVTNLLISLIDQQFVQHNHTSENPLRGCSSTF
jgi:hypothetical protein